MSGTIPQPDMKALFAKSGGVCAFPGCGKELVEAGNEQDNLAIVGEMAHIVGEKRQGPRGDFDLSDEDRNKESNLILLCATHHTLIDAQPRTYTVAVLRKMKADHESAIRMSRLGKTEKQPVRLVTDRNIHSTVLPVTHLPDVVFSAPCKFTDKEEDKVKQAIKYPKKRNVLVPFIIRENWLFAFYDLREKDNPFSDVIDTSKERPGWRRSVEMWDEAEGKRRYINLLNRTLYKYTSRIGVRYDPEHYRFYFPALEFGKERTVVYRPMNRDKQELKVVWQPITRKTGLPKGFWWHRAVKLQFQQFAHKQWGLAIRPERHLTLDSEQPLPSEEIGPKVTKLKSRMYNEGYLSEVAFWRDYLSRSQPRIILNLGSQSATINAELLKFDIEWAGIPNDIKPFKNAIYQEDLLTLAELAEAVTGEEIDWDDFEDEEEDYEDEF